MMTLIMKLIKVLSHNQVPKKRLMQMDGDIGVRQWINDININYDINIIIVEHCILIKMSLLYFY